jgi:hypothetical protein
LPSRFAQVVVVAPGKGNWFGPKNPIELDFDRDQRECIVVQTKDEEVGTTIAMVAFAVCQRRQEAVTGIKRHYKVVDPSDVYRLHQFEGQMESNGADRLPAVLPREGG